ncbi:MAG: non-ribosomal peptide synthetase, partial [Bacteroidetes bacterium]|nr:non-ribosomal peptide synthetase [Bacteroidota bacterium]
MTDINNQFKNVEMKPVDFDPFAHGEILITAPATEAQKEIWASVQMGPEANCAFNESMSIQVRGNIDGQVFNSAMNDIIVRHEALRTTFSPDGTVLSINKELLIDVPVIDLSGLEQNDRNKQLQDLLIQEVVEPFDLEYGPLVRSKIIKLQEKLFRILITAHHIICDGWAMAIVMQDLGKIYSARIKGFKPELPTPCLFSDYAIEDKLHFNSESGYETEKYWISQYNGAVPVLDFPTIHTRPLM